MSRDTEWRSMVSSLIKETELNLERVKRVEALTQLPLNSPALSMQPRLYHEVEEVEARNATRRTGAAALVGSQRVSENVRTITDRLDYQGEVVEVLVDAVAAAKRERDILARDVATMRDRVSFLEDALERAETEARKERDKSRGMRTELEHWKSGVEGELNHFRGLLAVVTRSVSAPGAQGGADGAFVVSALGDGAAGLAAVGRLSRELADAMRVNKEEHDALLRQVQSAIGQCAKCEATLTSMDIGARDTARKLVALERRVEAVEEALATTGGARLLASEGARKEVADLRRLVKDMLARLNDQQRGVDTLAASIAGAGSVDKDKVFAHYFGESPRVGPPQRMRGPGISQYSGRALDRLSDVSLGPADITSASLGGSVAFECVGADEQSVATESDVTFSENTNSLLSRSSGAKGTSSRRRTRHAHDSASEGAAREKERPARQTSPPASVNKILLAVGGREGELEAISAVDSSLASENGAGAEERSWNDELSLRSNGSKR